MNFVEKLLNAARSNKSWLCIGLDPDISKIPQKFGNSIESILKFNKAIIEAASDKVCAFKPNSAFYESHGAEGWNILAETIKAVPSHIPVILDFKRGDIGNTSKMYAIAAFEKLGADAVTVSPYLGGDSIQPFLDFADKGVFVLCLTSNPSSADIQKKVIDSNSSSHLAIYEYIAELSLQWNKNKNIGLVVGASSTQELKNIRDRIGPTIPILIPGVGAQGGDLEKSIIAGSNEKGEMAIINVSRAIIYPGTDGDPVEKIESQAEFYRKKIQEGIENKLHK